MNESEQKLLEAVDLYKRSLHLYVQSAQLRKEADDVYNAAMQQWRSYKRVRKLNRVTLLLVLSTFIILLLKHFYGRIY